MKKTIKDLKLNDPVYMAHSAEIIELKVSSISNSVIILKSSGFSITHEFKGGELLCWLLKVNYYSSSTYNIYTEKLDCLKEVRSELEEQMKRIFERQEDFLKSVENKNKKIRDIDALIVEEKLKPKKQ